MQPILSWSILLAVLSCCYVLAKGVPQFLQGIVLHSRRAKKVPSARKKNKRKVNQHADESAESKALGSLKMPNSSVVQWSKQLENQSPDLVMANEGQNTKLKKSEDPTAKMTSTIPAVKKTKQVVTENPKQTESPKSGQIFDISYQKYCHFQHQFQDHI